MHVDTQLLDHVVSVAHHWAQFSRWKRLRFYRPERAVSARGWWGYLRKYVRQVAQPASPGASLRRWLRTRSDAKRYIQLYKRWVRGLSEPRAGEYGESVADVAIHCSCAAAF